MKPFPKIHDLYIGRVVLMSVMLTWAILVGLDAIISGLLTEMSDVGTGNYDFVAAATTVVYSLPRRAYMLSKSKRPILRPASTRATSLQALRRWARIHCNISRLCARLRLKS